ncbi:hypothetical protein EV144_104436 [Flavobacterium sp. 270]|uniref:hypothetical protein n=1 Tax=Flavobacterium sp. 270 TaxID=2512114 RepID=UPI001065BBE9|nr:hypothetical protein [Flavobacterium sp. 270]TDW48149.1 hypothetical protein EV144_104436 [Flavobacterium sp. 270]
MNQFLSSILLLMFATNSFSQNAVSLVPKTPSKAPDYFCTWNIQGYVCNFKSTAGNRQEMTENNMFGNGEYQNWVTFFPKIREDLIFVMDDSWDIPIAEISKDGPTFGLTELNQERFPSYTGNPAERLTKLVDAVKAKGWKGLGGWICAQEAPVVGNVNSEEYWTKRLKDANEAGFAYWKVDWGKQSRNLEWRKTMTKLGRTYAPNLVIEHAFNGTPLEFSDTYRTYDVENVIAQPVTIQRISELLKYKPQGQAKGIINCEDEPYIAAGLGCAIGIMRYPFADNIPNGATDYVFPAAGRNIKHRLDEVTRAVRWHRIAEPFGVGSDIYSVDTAILKDYWVLGERETWNKAHKPGDTLRENAPARVSRGLPLAKVLNPSPNQPFVLSSLYPNGAVAIATIGRGINREYITQRIKVEQEIQNIDNPIGIFGDYDTLTLILPKKIKASEYEVLGQDLASDKASVITKGILFKENKIIISGEIIRKIGLAEASKNDISDPGLVLKFNRKNK